MNLLAARPPRIELAPGLDIPRLVTGLWQVADQERGGTALDPACASAELAAYAAAGFDAFDMADHYGSAEVITGWLLNSPAGRAAGSSGAPIRAFTKWCPPPGPMTAEVVRAGVMRSIERLRVPCIDLLQFHWWTFEHPGWLDAMEELARLRDQGLIAQIGLTNFDTAHLRILLAEGVPVASNQVCLSLLDRRATEAMSELCLARGVKLLAYGTLAGGFLAERWLGAPEPAEVADWSKMKYLRFIEAVGGWNALQAVLRAAQRIADKHGASIANVATRWVLEQPAVAAAIVGARLGEREHRADNLAPFRFALDDEDRAWLQEAFARTQRIAGDCGDEYRRPPFLTASGDLSHHLDALPKVFDKEPVPGHDAKTGQRWRVGSGSRWEPLAGYSRAVRSGRRILVSGTTATHGAGRLVGRGDAAAQATWILDKIAAAVSSLGARIEDVVRTRVYLTDVRDWEAVAREHGRVFGAVRPANTLLQVGALVGEGYRVEIEAEAELRIDRESVRPS
jgi:aryl-alcohol dehydrogenase-like predicted oxidoreductase/enamine deaminase RidA (YjgF/YER057c/UK114 family)